MILYNPHEQRCNNSNKHCYFAEYFGGRDSNRNYKFFNELTKGLAQLSVERLGKTYHGIEDELLFFVLGPFLPTGYYECSLRLKATPTLTPIACWELSLRDPDIAFQHKKYLFPLVQHAIHFLCGMKKDGPPANWNKKSCTFTSTKLISFYATDKGRNLTDESDFYIEGLYVKMFKQIGFVTSVTNKRVLEYEL